MLSTLSLISKMLNSKNTAKLTPRSYQIARKYSEQTDGDWDDIMSPDDYEDYIDRRRYERSMRGY